MPTAKLDMSPALTDLYNINNLKGSSILEHDVWVPGETVDKRAKTNGSRNAWRRKRKLTLKVKLLAFDTAICYRDIRAVKKLLQPSWLRWKSWGGRIGHHRGLLGGEGGGNRTYKLLKPKFTDRISEVIFLTFPTFLQFYFFSKLQVGRGICLAWPSPYRRE